MVIPGRTLKALACRGLTHLHMKNRQALSKFCNSLDDIPQKPQTFSSERNHVSFPVSSQSRPNLLRGCALFPRDRERYVTSSPSRWSVHQDSDPNFPVYPIKYSRCPIPRIPPCRPRGATLTHAIRSLKLLPNILRQP